MHRTKNGNVVRLEVLCDETFATGCPPCMYGATLVSVMAPSYVVRNAIVPLDYRSRESLARASQPGIQLPRVSVGEVVPTRGGIVGSCRTVR